MSGVAEIAGGVGGAVPATRPLARWWLLALLAAVFPANVYMALHPDEVAERGVRRRPHPALACSGPACRVQPLFDLVGLARDRALRRPTRLRQQVLSSRTSRPPTLVEHALAVLEHRLGVLDQGDRLVDRQPLGDRAQARRRRAG